MIQRPNVTLNSLIFRRPEPIYEKDVDMGYLAPAACPTSGTGRTVLRSSARALPHVAVTLAAMLLVMPAVRGTKGAGAFMVGAPSYAGAIPGGAREEATTRATQLDGTGQVPANEESSNWSGYEDTGLGATFTEVAASWTVPTLEQGITGSSSTWVGIDGATTADLIQAGTEQDWTVSGPLYYAWYELLPGTAVDLGQVKPGDRVSADIEETLPGKWTISLTDSTSGSAWTEHVRYSAPGGSAEWVVEAPSSNSTDTVDPLAAFGSVTFAGLSASGPGTGTALATPVYLIHQADDLIEAYPGPYEAGTDSFTDYFGSPSNALATSSVAISSPASGPATPVTSASASTPAGDGYWLAGASGGLFSFGNARDYGAPSALRVHLPQPVVAIIPAEGYGGYWLVARDGGVFDFGGAPYEGSLPGLGIGPVGSKSKQHLTAPIVAAAPSADGKGYYLVSANGGVFTFGDAHYEGSCASAGGCTHPVTAIVPDGSAGYWLLLSDCEMLAMGGIPNIPSLGCQAYAKAHGLQAVAASRSPSGDGYWILLSNGAVFAEGDAKHLGGWQPPRPTGSKGPRAVALVPYKSGTGIWVAFADGAVKAYGSAPKLGDLSGHQLPAPIVASAGW